MFGLFSISVVLSYTKSSLCNLLSICIHVKLFLSPFKATFNIYVWWNNTVTVLLLFIRHSQCILHFIFSTFTIHKLKKLAIATTTHTTSHQRPSCLVTHPLFYISHILPSLPLHMLFSLVPSLNLSCALTNIRHIHTKPNKILCLLQLVTPAGVTI